MQARHKIFAGVLLALFAILLLYHGTPTSRKVLDSTKNKVHEIIGEMLNSNDLGDMTRTFHELYKPILVPVTAPAFDDDGKYYSINQIHWKEPLGKELCIADIDTRNFNQGGQLLSDDFSWTKTDTLSAGMLNHYLYASIHGYSYHFIQPNVWPNEERENVWTKIPILRDLLDSCKIVLVVDSDAVIQHLELPLEWLLNRWNFTQETSMALPFDVWFWYNEETGEIEDEWGGALDSHGALSLNAGVVIAQNLPRTKEMVDAWIACPDDNERFPGCDQYHFGWPAEQGAMNNYIRYAYNHSEDIRAIACNEANGYPGQHMRCSGVFLRHWTMEKDGVKNDVGQSLLQSLSYAFARQLHRGEHLVD